LPGAAGSGYTLTVTTTETPSALTELSRPGRLADEGEGIGLDEAGLAARNHGMPLELLAHDVTPLGAHYLLTHYDIPLADAATWTLEVGGLVRTPLSLSVADLRARPAVSRTVTMECAGNGRARLSPRPVSQPWLHEAVGTMTWTGTPLAGVLADAAPLEGAVDVVFTGADHGIEKGVEQDYQRSLSVEHAADPEVLLVWACNGVDLPPQHGYPLRLLVPGWYGMASVKWLRSVEVVDHRFDGYQMRAYSLRQAPDEMGERLTRIAPRALVQPPGFPDFLSRRRVVRPGPQVLTGRAWSGWGEVVSVEVSVDGGATWVGADVGPQPDPRAWRSWTCPWTAAEGMHVVSARATDATGRTQPAEPAWNRGGFANTAPQALEVLVVSADDRGGS
jgi:DMSO/TMAO reductase YedYZ molybdopterin-dependent catalytic subunit